MPLNWVFCHITAPYTQGIVIFRVNYARMTEKYEFRKDFLILVSNVNSTYQNKEKEKRSKNILGVPFTVCNFFSVS